MDWIWPVIDDADSARQAAHFAAMWSLILAWFSFFFGMFSGHVTASLGFMAAYGIATWYLFRNSYKWALIAFALCVTQTLLALISMPLLWSIMMPFAFLALMNGVRGTRVLQRF